MGPEDRPDHPVQPVLTKSLSVLTLDALARPGRRNSAGRLSKGSSDFPQGKSLLPNSPRQYAPVPTEEPEDLVDDFEFGREDLPEDGWHSCYLRWKRGDFTIVPEGNVFLDLWDIVVITALSFTALVLPFDVAMYEEEPERLRSVMRCVDMVFMTDIVLTFNVAYGVTTATNIDMYERAPLKIARRYMAFPFSDSGGAGWFWWDLLTIVPWDSFGNSQEFGLLRLLRLTRMFRLFRIVKVFAKLQMAYGYQISALTTMRTVLSTFVTLHWVACCWSHLAIASEDKELTWLYGWLQRHGHQKPVDECTCWEVYNLALYWCISTLTSVGYGDVLPQNQLEVSLLSFTMILLGSLWAWVLAYMVSILQHMDVFATETHQLMDDLNVLMKHRGLDKSLRQRCRKHLHESMNVHRQRHQQRTVKWLSAGLQGEIAVESGVDKACNCVWYLQNVPKPVLIAIAQRFIGDIFSPNEYINVRYSVAVIRKGTCIRRRRLLTRDDCIGEDMILATDHLVDYLAPKSLTFVEVMTLSRSDLVSVCESHPDFDRRMRKAQVKLAVWRAIIVEADARRRGKVSVLQVNPPPNDNASAGGRRLTFSQSLGPVGYRGMSPQETMADIVETLGAMRRRMEDTHCGFTKEVAALSGRVDDLLERAGLPKRRSGLPWCGRMR